MSGLLGPMVAQGITPDSGQGQLATAISSFFGGGTPQFQTPTPQAQAPAAPTQYDMWGRPVAPGAAPTPAPQQGAPATPSLNTGPGLPTAGLLAQPQANTAITPGASGYDMWGRQAPAPAAPQLPGLGDLLAMVQAAQAQQQQQQPPPDTSGAVRAMTGNYG
jgi:hypothetical protein